MNNKLIIPLLLVGMLLGYVATRQSHANAQAQTQGTPTYAVDIYADKIEPSTTIIPLGATLQMNNKDTKPHNIAQGAGNDYSLDHAHLPTGPESGSFGPSEAYQVTFDKPGTYTFHDHTNPNLVLTAIVYIPQNAQKSMQ